MARSKYSTKQSGHIPDKVISLSALIVSLISATFSYQQMRSSEQQVLLNSQQLRPHVTIDPIFSPEEKELRITIYSRNHSSLPARLLFFDIAVAVDDQIFENHFFSASSDIIHQNKNAVSTLPPIPKTYSSKVIQGESTLIVSTCAIYTSTTDTDKRRWMVNMSSEYVPGLDVGSRNWIEESQTSTDNNKCEAKNLLRRVMEEVIKQ